MANTTEMMTTEADGDTCPDIYTYKCSDMGTAMPFVNEYTWPVGFRAALYCIGLLWSFLGVAIIADVFMCSIEKITSKTRRLKIADDTAEGGVAVIEVKVWNNTVANLTLMALGSSAPARTCCTTIRTCWCRATAGMARTSTAPRAARCG